MIAAQDSFANAGSRERETGRTPGLRTADCPGEPVACFKVVLRAREIVRGGRRSTRGA